MQELQTPIPQLFQGIIDKTKTPGGAVNTPGVVNLTGRLTMSIVPAPQPGYVYLVWAIGTPRYKIGKSKDPARRIEELNKQSCYPLKLLETAYFDNCKAQEERLHKALAQWRVHGEWFELPERLISHTEEWLKNPKITSVGAITNSKITLHERGASRAVYLVKARAKASTRVGNVAITIPHEIDLISQAIGLLGSAAKGCPANSRLASRLTELLGSFPRTKEEASEWKSLLKQQKKSLAETPSRQGVES